MDGAKRVARKGLARLVALVVAVVALTCAVGVAPAGAAGPTGIVMATTQRMGGPSLNGTQYGWYTKGTKLALVCYVRGQSVHGYFGGPDNLWYRVSDGKYAADIDLQTYSNAPITGPCTTQSGKADRAVSWARSQVGSESYYGLCELFVERAYGTSGRYGSALAAFSALRAAGTMRYTTTNIPAGALVFSDGPLDGPYGHVMLSIGGGQFVSGGANGPSVKVFTTPNPGSTFLGWSPAPSSWPGR